MNTEQTDRFLILKAEKEKRKEFWQWAKQTSSCGSCTTHGCCKQLVLVSSFEIFLLFLEHSKTIDLLWENLLHQAANENRAITTDPEKIESPGFLQARERIIPRYFGYNNFCTFYTNKNCAIYDIRPLPCVFEALAKGNPSSFCEPTQLEDIPLLNCKQLYQTVLSNCKSYIDSLGLELFPSLSFQDNKIFPLPLAMSIIYHVVLFARRGWLDPQNPQHISLEQKVKVIQLPWLSSVNKIPYPNSYW